MKERIQNLVLEWEHTGVTYADVYIVLTDTSRSLVIFGSPVYAGSGSFFYTISETIYDQTSGANFLNLEVSTSTDLDNGDAAPVIDITTCLVTYDATGQLHVDTTHYATLSANTDTLDTTHSVTLDRTEHYTSGAQIFWDTSDVSGVSDVTNAEHIYSNETRSEFCMFPKQTSGYLKVKRTSVALYEGVDGTVVLDTSMTTKYPGAPLNVYLSANDTSAGTYLGNVDSMTANNSFISKNFIVPTSLMVTLSDASFAGMTLSLSNDTTVESWWQISDSIFKYSPLTKAYLDTSHSALVTDSTVPTIWKYVETTHKARIKKGAYYVLEYYTKNDWWDFDA